MRRIFVTGGSGTFGSAYIGHVLQTTPLAMVVSFARGEHRQAELKRMYPTDRLETWLGDVRDRDRLAWALRSKPDAVVHCAALKRIESCEQDPDEARKTNIDGTRHVCQEAMLADVPKVLVISSDKACAPETIYGHTKAAAESLAIGQNRYRGGGRTRISVARYGNVLGSQGSVLDVIAQTRGSKRFQITDPESTRFWWSVDAAVAFVDSVLDRMSGGEIWVPKIPSAKVTDLVRALVPEVVFETVGMRGQEKRHESMIAASETTWEFDDCYVIAPSRPRYTRYDAKFNARDVAGVKMPDGFTFTSNDHPGAVTFHRDAKVGV